MVSHDLSLTARTCDILALLAEGRICASGPPREVLTVANLETVFGVLADIVVAPDGQRAIKRNVRLGRRNVRDIEVLDGLEAGEQVITSPYTNYLDMDRLELQGE